VNVGTGDRLVLEDGVEVVANDVGVEDEVGVVDEKVLVVVG
jgi:hypothetical protein